MDYPMRFPRCNATDESYCAKCGEPDPAPNVEAFEEFGEAVCMDCGIAMLEDAADDD